MYYSSLVALGILLRTLDLSTSSNLFFSSDTSLMKLSITSWNCRYKTGIVIAQTKPERRVYWNNFKNKRERMRWQVVRSFWHFLTYIQNCKEVDVAPNSVYDGHIKDGLYTFNKLTNASFMETRKNRVVKKIHREKGFDVFPVCNLVKHQEKAFDLWK